MNLEQIKEFYAKLQVEETFHGQNSPKTLELFFQMFGDSKLKKMFNNLLDTLRNENNIKNDAQDKHTAIVTDKFITTRKKRELQRKLADATLKKLQEASEIKKQRVALLFEEMEEVAKEFSELTSSTMQFDLINKVTNCLNSFTTFSLEPEHLYVKLIPNIPPYNKRDRDFYEGSGLGFMYKEALREDAKKHGLHEELADTKEYIEKVGCYIYGERYIEYCAKIVEDYIERKELEQIARLKAETDPEYKSIKEIVKEKYGVKLW
ncbi:TPA: hypothetical protein ACGOZ1_001217 [Streptococcus suis]